MSRTGPRGLKSAILQLLNEKISYAMIASQLGVSKGTIAFHAKRNNLNKYVLGSRKSKKACLVCDKLIPTNKKFCCNQHTQAYAYNRYIQLWKAGAVSGRRTGGILSQRVKRYLFETRGRKCEKCGWAEIHPKTGVVPVMIDHKDGHWQNCSEDNLEILCPNCHSLTPTYGSLNNGNGHPLGKLLYRRNSKTIKKTIQEEWPTAMDRARVS